MRRFKYRISGERRAEPEALPQERAAAPRGGGGSHGIQREFLCPVKDWPLALWALRLPFLFGEPHMGAFGGKEGLASVHQEVPDSPPLYLAGHRHVTSLSQLVTPLRPKDETPEQLELRHRGGCGMQVQLCPGVPHTTCPSVSPRRDWLSLDRACASPSVLLQPPPTL